MKKIKLFKLIATIVTIALVVLANVHVDFNFFNTTGTQNGHFVQWGANEAWAANEGVHIWERYPAIDINGYYYTTTTGGGNKAGDYKYPNFSFNKVTGKFIPIGTPSSAGRYSFHENNTEVRENFSDMGGPGTRYFFSQYGLTKGPDKSVNATIVTNSIMAYPEDDYGYDGFYYIYKCYTSPPSSNVVSPSPNGTLFPKGYNVERSA